jgi:hypothetical protein
MDIKIFNLALKFALIKICNLNKIALIQLKCLEQGILSNLLILSYIF